ncbi:shikimate kinase [Halolamina pelagica]|uniref:Shikimate kinase n=1 Tax=Halolamina pelagica TaxID=699431 RepID=A0A0P7FXH6_9EURY|nr:shikimate kinase [Halolamina pelagica]
MLNALATGRGSAFALDFETSAHVDLDDSGEVVGEIDGQPDADTELIERCVSLTLARWGDDPAAAELPQPVGGTVRTESDVPTAAGLKSSSAAANATVLATVDALGLAGIVDHEAACRVGVQAAREAGVTVTGAFDDASASMLGDSPSPTTPRTNCSPARKWPGTRSSGRPRSERTRPTPTPIAADRWRRWPVSWRSSPSTASTLGR